MHSHKLLQYNNKLTKALQLSVYASTAILLHFLKLQTEINEKLAFLQHMQEHLPDLAKGGVRRWARVRG